MSYDLDPKEVLMHLHQLGYYNITPEQLQEFIKDLRRLIKYDTAKKTKLLQSQTSRPNPCVVSAGNQSGASTLPNTSEESRSPSPPRVKQHRKDCQSHSAGNTRKDPPQVSASSSESSITAIRTVLRECEKYAQTTHGKGVEAPSKPVPGQHKRPKSCNHSWRNLGCESCDENWHKEQHALKSKENLPPRPKSSFIRTGQARASQRCDPVTLYHQYQQLWKQQKLPGENNHNELRWSIRERMLGQDAQSRPLSQASSVSSVNRRQKRL